MQAEALLRAALDLKYLLDIQPEGSLFHPSGQDARLSCAYRQASTLIERAIGGGRDAVSENVVRGSYSEMVLSLKRSRLAELDCLIGQTAPGLKRALLVGRRDLQALEIKQACRLWKL